MKGFLKNIFNEDSHYNADSSQKKYDDYTKKNSKEHALDQSELSDNDEEIKEDGQETAAEYEVVEFEVLPNKIICPDCGGITLEGLEFCDKCGGEL